MSLASLAADVVDTTIGPLLLVADGDGAVVRLDFLTADADAAAALARLRRSAADGSVALAVPRLGAVAWDPSRLRALGARLHRYLAGDGDILDLVVAPRGTAFQRAVWEQLRTIPVGSFSTYAAVAAACGRPRAVRAAGAAIGANPVVLVIPCHRVVGSDGSLTGFGGGLPSKRRLLEMEGVLAPGARRVEVRRPQAG